MEIVGLCGVIGSGKDYQAGLLVDKGFVRMSFAETLRRIAEVMFGYPPLAFDDSVLYEKFKKSFVYFDSQKQAIDGRLFLQKIGTEAGRNLIGENVWVDALFNRANLGGYHRIVIPDVRFPNEVRSIFKRGGEVLMCDYHSERYDAKNTHASETMAQQLLSIGKKDMDWLTEKDLIAIELVH